MTVAELEIYAKQYLRKKKKKKKKKRRRKKGRCGHKLVLKATLGEGKSEYVFIKTTP